MDKLARLIEEFDHTEGLLRSKGLSPLTRRVLEALRADLQRQISEEQTQSKRQAAAD